MTIDPTARVHASSVVEPGAKLGAGVTIGPFCHVGSEVSLGEGVKLVSHVAVAGRQRDTNMGFARSLATIVFILALPIAIVTSNVRILLNARDELLERVR